MIRFVRIWLPVIVVVAGLIAIAFNPTVDGLEGAAHIIGAGLAIALLNLLFRVGVTGDRTREEEDEARAYFDRHGHWPDEAPPVPARDPHVAPHKRGPHPRR